MHKDIGRVCVKLRGSDAGRKVVIVAEVEGGSFLVTGPPSLSRARRKTASSFHLRRTEFCVDIPEGADDEVVRAALDAADLSDFMRDTVALTLDEEVGARGRPQQDEEWKRVRETYHLTPESEALARGLRLTPQQLVSKHQAAIVQGTDDINELVRVLNERRRR